MAGVTFIKHLLSLYTSILAEPVMETSLVWGGADDGLNSGAGKQDGLGPRAGRRYIEDEEPEWRQLDYQMEVKFPCALLYCPTVGLVNIKQHS